MNPNNILNSCMPRRISRYAVPAVLLASFASWNSYVVAQEANPTSQDHLANDGNPTTQQNGVYLYKVKVVQRDLDAVNYLHRSGSTTIKFEGTPLLAKAKGRAKVESQRGGITIDAEFQGLTPANGFGAEYLTYVLWAITPDGRPQNLGEILPSHDKNNIHVTTAFQSFGLIVTAEPYYAVSQPSDVVVLQNVIRDDKTQGVLEKVNAHYTLLPRGMYAETAGAKTVSDPITRNLQSPLEIYEAHNAYRIAQSVGADKYSTDSSSSPREFRRQTLPPKAMARLIRSLTTLRRPVVRRTAAFSLSYPATPLASRRRPARTRELQLQLNDKL